MTLTTESFLQHHGHPLPRLLADRLANVGLHGELVGPVTHRHEGALEGVPVDGAAYLDEPGGAEELHRARHHDVGPASLRGALLQGRRESLVQLLSLGCARQPALTFAPAPERRDPIVQLHRLEPTAPA